MIFNLTLTGNGDHVVIVEANAGYIKSGIGYNEYWGAPGWERFIEFECEIESVMLISRTGKRARKIAPTCAQNRSLESLIKRQIDIQSQDIDVSENNDC